MLPNYFNDSLDLFSADGTALGSLKPVGAAGETAWHPATQDGGPVEAVAGDPASQAAAIALYRKAGYVDIPRFGPYVDDPTSVCMEQQLV